MIPRSRIHTILGLALPIVGGMLSQNVLNLVDTAMVGTLGDAALAAVGIGGFANFMAIAFTAGLSSSVQAMAARRLGAGRTSETAVPLNGALLLAFGLAIPLSVLLYWLAPVLFPLLSPDQAVIDDGVPYLRARLVAMAAVGVNFSFRGYWNGINRSALYLRTLLVMHTCNIFLNWVLIFGNLGAPALGAEGAGIASAIAVMIGAAYYFVLALRFARVGGFLRGLPDRGTMRTMIRLAAPTGLQSFLFSAGFTALYWIIGQVGTAETAAANVLINLVLVAILPGLAMGMAAATLVGQALGRKDPEDAKQWGWDVIRLAVVVLAVLGLPMLLVPKLILSGFIHDEATLELARAPLQIVGATIAIDAFGLVLQHALFGAGATRTMLVVSVSLQWGLFLPAAYLAGPVWGFGLLGIWIVQVFYRGVQALTLVTIWRRGKWAGIEV